VQKNAARDSSATGPSITAALLRVVDIPEIDWLLDCFNVNKTLIKHRTEEHLMFINLRNIAVISTLVLAGLVSAKANTLTPGQTAAPDQLFPNGSNLVVKTGTAMGTGFTDTYTAGVYADNSNPFCAGCLDFYFIFTNNGPGDNERFTASNFSDFLTDVGIHGPGGVNNPGTVDRSSDGSVIGFNYTGSGVLSSGKTTNILIIATNATQYGTGTFSIQDGLDGSKVTVAGFEPVPEPTSLALFGTGVLSLVGMAKRKFFA
jgi:hypothetical protein